MGSAILGGWSLIKLAVTLFGVFVIAVAIWGYSRAHSAAFKSHCAAYEAHEAPMSFPDNLLCVTYWKLK